MGPLDDFSRYYGEFIAGSYDCLDRIVVNAYYPLGQTGGGFRSWWRQWRGDDRTLTTGGLKAAAGDLARRLRAWCHKNKAQWIECKAGEIKYERARECLPKDPKFRGIFAVLVGRAPAPIWEVRYNAKGQITELRRAESWPHVQHYYFQIMDPEWGHVVVRMCGYPPWGVQVIVNGHEWVEQTGRKQKLKLSKSGNCFVGRSGFGAVEKLADQLLARLGPELLALCERWIYSSCLCFALPVTEQERTGFRYRYSVWQLEYSRNLLFKDSAVMEEVFQKVLDRTRAPLDIKTLETIFGRRHRQPTISKQRAGRSAAKVSKEIDHRDWDTTVLRVRWGNLLLKMYEKGGSVLRVEVVVQNTTDLKCGKGLERLGDHLAKMRELLLRFLGAVQAAHKSFLDCGQFEQWHQPTQRGSRRLAGIDLNKARNRAVVDTVSSLATRPEGFTGHDVAQGVRSRMKWTEEQYSTRRASYDLAKLRGKKLVERCPGRRRYQCRAENLKILCGYVILREQVIKPLLAGTAQKRPYPAPNRLSPLDQHYVNLCHEMEKTFKTIGLEP